MLKHFLKRHWSFILTDKRLYIPALLLVFIGSFLWSLQISSWVPISRFGSIIVIFGAVLGLRRHFRLGATNVENEAPPTSIPVGSKGVHKLSVAGINEGTFRGGDLKLQLTGLKLAVFGTFLWGYGDAIFQFIYAL
jgi:hypothetical protein